MGREVISVSFILYRFLLVMIFILYIAGLISLYIVIQATWIFTAFIFIFNFIVLFLVGNYLLRGILFPYANTHIRRQLDSAINKRFSTEFSRLMLLLAKMVRIMAGVDPIETYYQSKDELNNSFEDDSSMQEN